MKETILKMIVTILKMFVTILSMIVTIVTMNFHDIFQFTDSSLH